MSQARHIHATTSRRNVLKGAGALAGLCLYVRSASLLAAEDPKKYGADAMPGGVVDDPLVFVTIGEDNFVTVTIHRAEMGQGIRTSLAMVVADELDAEWSRVRVVQAHADEARFGSQNTDGSRSMQHFFLPMRRVGASARAMLEAAAAIHWGVPSGEVVARNHEIIHLKSDRRVPFGAMAKRAFELPVPTRDALRMKDPAQFRYIGKSGAPLIDGADIVEGRAQYGIDTRLDGLLYAVIARPPVTGGSLRKYEAAGAMKVRGVVKVVELKGSGLPPLYNALGGVAVIADNTWAAMKGREALVIEWDDGPNNGYDSSTYKETLLSLSRKPANAVRSDGDALGELARSERRVVAEYYLPHVAHATMEPPTATASFAAGKCEVWAGVQAPQDTRDTVARSLGIKPEQVTVHVTLLGGGFGRRSKPDFVAEAALLSRAMEGRPVKVTWTREDDLRHDYYHTVSMQHLEASLDERGYPKAWLHRSTAPTIAAIFSPQAKTQQPFEYGMGAVNVPFRIPNLRVEIPEVEAHTRIGWFRSVSNIPHAFAVQCFVAELAAAAGRDPKDYLLELIGPARTVDPRKLTDHWNYGESPDTRPLDTARLRGVIELATREAAWGRKMPANNGLGLAATYSFMTYVAAVVQVVVGADGELSIPRIDVAFDCGPQVNPDRIRAQVEGSCIMGVSLATQGEIGFQRGRVVQSNFHDYPIARINESPREVQVHLIPNSFDKALGGVGEPAMPPIAPALCNAIFAATGKRIRHLPIGNQLSARGSEA